MITLLAIDKIVCDKTASMVPISRARFKCSIDLLRTPFSPSVDVLEFIRACDVISLAGRFQCSHLGYDDVRSP
jgi:hypothetical protein